MSGIFTLKSSSFGRFIRPATSPLVRVATRSGSSFGSIASVMLATRAGVFFGSVFLASSATASLGMLGGSLDGSMFLTSLARSSGGREFRIFAKSAGVKDSARDRAEKQT